MATPMTIGGTMMGETMRLTTSVRRRLAEVREIPAERPSRRRKGQEVPGTERDRHDDERRQDEEEEHGRRVRVERCARQPSPARLASLAASPPPSPERAHDRIGPPPEYSERRRRGRRSPAARRRSPALAARLPRRDG